MSRSSWGSRPVPVQEIHCGPQVIIHLVTEAKRAGEDQVRSHSQDLCVHLGFVEFRTKAFKTLHRLGQMSGGSSSFLFPATL